MDKRALSDSSAMAQGIRSSQSSGGPSLSRAAALDPVLGFCNSLLLSLLGLFLSLAFIVDFSYAQNITKLENGLPIRYTITNVSSWPALGGAFFFGSTTPIGQAIGGPGLLITNNSFDQVHRFLVFVGTVGSNFLSF